VAIPTCFLEVGYAWGRGRPVLLVCQKDDGRNPLLPFDVAASRCLFYEDAVELEELMRGSMEGLSST